MCRNSEACQRILSSLADSDKYDTKKKLTDFLFFIHHLYLTDL